MEKTGIKLDVWIYRLTLILIALVLISTWMLSGLSARFTTSAYADESASVAAFDADGAVIWSSSQNLTTDIEPGQSQVATIKISNASEVAVAYTVHVLNNSNNLPIKFLVDGDSIDNASAKEYTYTSEQPALSTAQAFSLNIYWPNEEGTDNLDYIGMVDYITVTVTATQID